MSNYSDSAYDDASTNTSWYKVMHLISDKTVVLDIGCSSGNFGKELAKRKNCTVDGIELDEQDAKIAARNLRNVWRLNIETDDLKNIPPHAYDVIYFGDVIEHLVNPVETLKRIKILLKEGGRVVFSIPNMAHIGIRLGLIGGDFEYTETGLLDKTHLHYYTQEEVYRVFKESGYQIVKLDFVKKDYPHQLISKQLSLYGLKATPKFFKKMQQSDASAFQFVGSVKVGSTEKVKRKQFGPIDHFESFYNDTLTNHAIEKKSLQAKINELEILLSHRENHPYRGVARHLKSKLPKRT